MPACPNCRGGIAPIAANGQDEACPLCNGRSEVGGGICENCGRPASPEFENCCWRQACAEALLQKLTPEPVEENISNYWAKSSSNKQDGVDYDIENYYNHYGTAKSIVVTHPAPDNRRSRRHRKRERHYFM